MTTFLVYKASDLLGREKPCEDAFVFQRFSKKTLWAVDIDEVSDLLYYASISGAQSCCFMVEYDEEFEMWTIIFIDEDLP